MSILARIPIHGYRSQRNFSHSSMGWLTWKELKHGRPMRHAWHPLGEKYLPDAHVWADGYVEETNTVYSYFGCYFHAHVTGCKMNSYSKSTYSPRMKMTMGDIDLETKRWCKRVRHCGYNLVCIYECRWQEKLKRSQDKRDHVAKLGLSGSITGRSALYSGRTEAIALHASGDEDNPIKYIDVVSIFFLNTFFHQSPDLYICVYVSTSI